MESSGQSREANPAGCLRLSLLILTGLGSAIGMASLGFGIYSTVNEHALEKAADFSEKSGTNINIGTLLIIIGSALFLSEICGFIGAWRSHTSTLKIFAGLSFLIVGCYVGGIVIAVLKNKNRSTIGQLNKQLDEKIKNLNSTNINYMDNVQSRLKCCGGRSYKDYSLITWQFVFTFLPESCCPAENAFKCSKVKVSLAINQSLIWNNGQLGCSQALHESRGKTFKDSLILFSSCVLVTVVQIAIAIRMIIVINKFF